jgi:P27 family predicted phage terminase small subunit
MDEPVVAMDLPEPPDYLSDRARVEWARAGALLKDAGLMTPLDAVAFGRFCQLVARISEAEEGLAKHGLLVKSTSNNGGPMVSPYLSIVNQCSKQLVLLCAEFGMTPSSRSRVRVDNQVPNDDFERFLRRE